MSSISQEELQNIILQLEKNIFFSSYKKDIIEEFVKNCHLHKFPPHKVVWNKRREKLDVSVLLDGCLVVWDKSYGEETIDALITTGQIIGEFEFLGYESKSFEISALRKYKILSSTKENVEKLCKSIKVYFTKIYQSH